MDKLQVTSLNSLFNHFDQQDKTVFWIVNRTVERQLYVSAAFEMIWGRRAELLYENIACWMDFVAEEDRENLRKAMQQRFSNIENNQHNQLLFRIIDAKGNNQYIKDSAYVLVDDKGECKGFAGFGEQVADPEMAFRQNQDPYYQQMQMKLKSHVQGILKYELGLNTIETKPPVSCQNSAENIVVMHQGKPLAITPREQQCLYYLMQGNSAKQTANHLHVSTRTVEFHLNNLRLKAGCRNKTGLIAKIVMKIP